jgi:hypothetical protein
MKIGKEKLQILFNTANATVPIAISEGKPVSVSEFSKIGLDKAEKANFPTKDEHFKLLTIAYYEQLAREYPNTKIVNVNGLHLSFADIVDHVAKETAVGKDLMQIHKETILNILKELKANA